jgi:protein-tyrosine phosphatase
MSDRQIYKAFEGMENFRDVGNFRLPSGRSMRSGQVFRSEELSRLSMNDWEQLHKLGIKCIVDFRTPNERKLSPYKALNVMGIQIVHIPILSEEKDLNRWQFFCFLLREGRSLDFEEYMRKFYYRLAFERVEQIKAIFTLLSDAQALPILIHCTGGKDRTGFIAASLQLFVGVPRDDVIHSYLASNEVIVMHMKKIERYIQWMSLWQISPERLRPMLEVRREYLESIFDEIFYRYGSVDKYLSSYCGVEERCLDRLCALLIE